MATKESVTAVFWDIKKRPVPSADAASQVGPVIKKALENLGYSGPLTISAVGILKDVPMDILRAVYSSGVSLINVESECFGIDVELQCWKSHNEFGNLMLISPEPSFIGILVNLGGHRIIPYLPFVPPKRHPQLSQNWESFLTSLPRGPALLDEDPGWSCQECGSAGKGFENYTAHFKKTHVEFFKQETLTKRSLRNQPQRMCKKSRK